MPSEPARLMTAGLSRSFGGLRAVRDVSLRLAQGELHAVIGPNGAGKSTLVNLLSGWIRPSSGTIAIDGHDVTGLPAYKFARAGVGRSFQRTNVLATLPVLENVRLAAQAIPQRGGTTLSRQIERAHEALETVGLSGDLSRRALELSHGEQRQLEIAMALACEPKVLLLDEPLAGMGQEEGLRMADLLKRLSLARAVLLIEHDMEFVFKVADRMTVMVDGAVLASGAPQAIRANADVQRAYLGGHA